MVISPTKWIICQTDLADGLATISEKTDASTPLFRISALFNSCLNIDATINAFIYVLKQKKGCIVWRTNELFFQACKKWCTMEDEQYVVTTHKAKH